MTRLGRYVLNLLIAVDDAANAVLGGDPQETISSRAAKGRAEGKPWATWLANLLDSIDPGHCARAVETDRGGDAVFPD
jgi:hypothetical protein